MDRFLELQDYLKSLGRVVVAFSGGVDSTFLLKAATCIDSKDLLAATFSSEAFSQDEMLDASNLAALLFVRHELFQINHLEIVPNNPDNRCYICKKKLFGELVKYAHKKSYDFVIDGSNADDAKSHRPGRIAAMELGIKSPLEVLNFNKNEIRTLSKKLNLPTYNKQQRPCYLTRFPYNMNVTLEMIKHIDNMEINIVNLGIGLLRLRYENSYSVRIVVSSSDMVNIIKNKDKILSICRKYGYTNVLLDLTAYGD